MVSAGIARSQTRAGRLPGRVKVVSWSIDDKAVWAPLQAPDAAPGFM
jgi:hypothetical protein